MAVYAIGDVQGCYQSLRRLLDKIAFDESKDELWFAGDLVNRGPESLNVLRFVRSLGDSARVVLGNHDLHMLAVADNIDSIRKKDTFQDVLKAKDADELLEWLHACKLVHYDAEFDIAMVHAGLVPQWSVQDALKYAAEVEQVLQSEQRSEFFANMYGDKPSRWSDELMDWERLRFITNTLTRIRFCDAAGRKILSEKGEVGSQPEGFMPWFELQNRASWGQKVLFGHWAALGAGKHSGQAWSLDSGCVWGGSLTALRIDKGFEFFSVVCSEVA